MVATLEAVWDRGHVVFGAACYMHGLLTSPDWQTLEVVLNSLPSQYIYSVDSTHIETAMLSRLSQSQTYLDARALDQQTRTEDDSHLF